MPSFSFGLDFGTSKTAITLARAGVINPQVDEVAVDGQHDRIATCVLRRDDQVFVGQAAEQEFLAEHDPAVRKRMEFFSNFKPHIHQSADYRKIACEFMTALRGADGLAQELERHFGDAIIAVGCPVAWITSGAQQALLRLLNDAGFPPAFAVPEPVGAAFHFLGARLKAQDFHNTIVVIDWGAGTFDMTALRAGRIEVEAGNNWGSTVYGGRLFDDLFYQWLLETAEKQGHSADVRRLDQQQVDRAILHGLMVRQIKEAFSRFYAGNEPDRRWTYSYPVVIMGEEAGINLGNFEIPRIGQLSERMRAYRASPMARPWLEMAQAEVQPEEREFFDPLLDGREVDLQAWGRRLIEVGLRKLAVDDKSIAVLTGGSCNWKWFQDEVYAQPPFQGRSLAVLYDGKPELTIARGLARAYAVGSYAMQLMDQVRAARARLMLSLQDMHAEVIERLSYSLTAEMKRDERFRSDLQRIFEDAFNRAALARSQEPKQKGLLDRLREALARFWASLSKASPQPGAAGTAFDDLSSRFKGALEELLKDPHLDAIRPDLEQRIGRWIGENRGNLESWDERFALRAHRQIMELLKAHINQEIGGFVEVAIEACSAVGTTTFDVALRDLGGKLRLGPGMVATLLDETARRLRDLAGAGVTSEADKTDEARRQAEASTNRLFDDLPGAIKRNLEQVQPAATWAQLVIDDLIKTLETLARVARVESAPRA
jgi:Hsp70 protein